MRKLIKEQTKIALNNDQQNVVIMPFEEAFLHRSRDENFESAFLNHVLSFQMMFLAHFLQIKLQNKYNKNESRTYVKYQDIYIKQVSNNFIEIT